MASEENETPVDDRYAVTIPASVRASVGLQPGDRLRWQVDDQNRLVAEVVTEQYGLADDLEPVDMGDTDAVRATDSYDWS